MRNSYTLQTYSLSPGRLLRVVLAGLFTLMLAACGGGGGGSIDVGSTGASTSSGVVVFGGSIGDGPVTGANVTVLSARGDTLGVITSDRNAAYQARITPEAGDYPIQLIVNGGTDLVTGRQPDFQMESFKAYPRDTVVNVNPFSTLVSQVARRLPGGLNNSNINTAKSLVMGRLTFGLDRSSLPDPITSPLTTGNVAKLVKASEALGEAIRRTRDRMNASGAQINGNSVVRALAADMVDGHPDGLGASGTNAKLTAVFNVVTAQVLVETLSNNLRVNGVIATNIIDQSILSTYPGISSSQLTGSVRVTHNALSELRTAIAAVRALDNSAAVANISTVVGGLYAGATPGAVANVLPASSTNGLTNAVNAIPFASSAKISSVNQTVYAQGSSGSGSSGSTGGSTGGGSTPTTGSLSLRWTAPSARSDGSALALSEIGGYKIYYGTSRGNYSGSYDQTNGAATSATVSNLASGTYYLAMSTYDRSGREGSRSAEVTKSVP